MFFDEETGLDFAEARYYYNNHGRFTAVDPLLASGKSADPQTFNRYAYVMNRPLILIDSLGMAPEIIAAGNDQQGYLERLQSEMPSVTLGIDKETNKVIITGFNSPSLCGDPSLDGGMQNEIISNMSDSEASLFKAITDTQVTATVTLTPQDGSFDYGKSNDPGSNTIDMSDLAAIDSSPDPGITSSQVASHETLEAYYGAKSPSGSLASAHATASSYFPGLGANTTNYQIDQSQMIQQVQNSEN